MKAIICDTCGKSVPDTKEADILPLYMRLGLEPAVKVINRDICPVCMGKLVKLFDPAVPELEDVIVPEVGPVIQTPAEAEAEVTTLEPVEHVTEPQELIQEPIVKQAPPQTLTSEMTTIICAHCGKTFTSKRKEAKCCSHYCASHKWLTDQKKKKENEPKKEKPPKPPKPPKPLKPLKMKTTPQEPKPQTKPMPTKKEKIKESSHINHAQDLIAEIVHPEIDKKRKAAIEKSPKIRNEDLVQVPGMPRTWVQFKAGADPHSLENFQERVGKANLGGVQSSKKSKDQIPEEEII